MSTGLSFLDRYHPGGSFVHRADARVKLILTVAFIAATTSTPPAAWPVFLLLAVLEWAFVLASRLPVSMIVRRSLLALPFVLVAAPTVFTKAGDPLFSLSILSWTITVSDQGLAFFLSVLVKALISVIAAATLAATTPFLDMIQAMRALRIPRLLVAISSFMYRYIFVLVDEAQRLMRARAARSTRLSRRGGGTIRWRARVLGGMVGSLFLRTYERSERIYQAMASRGFDGEIRLIAVPPLLQRQRALVALALAFLVALEVVASLRW